MLGVDVAGLTELTDRIRRIGIHVLWQCCRDYLEGDENYLCSNCGNNVALGRILDGHLLRGLRYALAGDRSLVKVMTQGRDEDKGRVLQLKATLAEAEADLDVQEKIMQAMTRGWAAAGPEYANQAIDKYTATYIQPIMARVVEHRRDLEAAQAAGLTTAITQTEREVAEILTQATREWDNLTVEKRRAIITLLVDHVVVWTGEGATRECLIAFTWNTGATDYLVGWRGWDRDARPWTPDEDDALRKTWRTSEWEIISAALQPGRKYHATRRRAMHIGLGSGSKARLTQATAAEKTWADRHPEALYLLLEPAKTLQAALEGEALTVGEKGIESDVISVPLDVAGGVQIIQSTFCWTPRAACSAPARFRSAICPRLSSIRVRSLPRRCAPRRPP